MSQIDQIQLPPAQVEVIADIKAMLAQISTEEILELGTADIDAGIKLIESSSQAEEYIRRIKAAQAEYERDIDHAMEEQAKLNRRQEAINLVVEQATRKRDNAMEFNAKLLEEYTRRTLEGASKKSLKLVEGTLALKAQSPEYVYDDEALTKWLLEHDPKLIKYKASPDKAELKKQAAEVGTELKLNGVVVGGVTLVPRADAFSIK